MVSLPSLLTITLQEIANNIHLLGNIVVNIVYQTSRPQSLVTAPNIPIMVSLCHNLVRLPPISLLQRGKKQMKSSFQESDHALPCPTLWFFKSKADGHIWKEEGLLAAEVWTPKGTYIAEQKKNNSDFCSRQ